MAARLVLLVGIFGAIAIAIAIAVAFPSPVFASGSAGLASVPSDASTDGTVDASPDAAGDETADASVEETADASLDSLAIVPSTARVAPRAALMFTAGGGSGSGYVWSVEPNLSGARISPAGVYLAGTDGGVTDVVVVVDALGHAARAQVTVSLGQGLASDVELEPVSPPPPIASIEGGGGCSTTEHGARPDVWFVNLALALLVRRARARQARRTMRCPKNEGVG